MDGLQNVILSILKVWGIKDGVNLCVYYKREDVKISFRF